MLGWELPPHNSGGLGVACYQLCKALSKKGADIDFILPYSADHQIDFMKVKAAHPQEFSQVLKTGAAYDSYKYVRENGFEEWVDMFGQERIYGNSVDNIVDEAEFDVIHAHDWLTFRAALRARERSGKPLIVHIHSVESDRAAGGSGNPLVREIESTTLVLADKVIAVSQHTKNAIIRDYDIPEDKIEVVHNSIELGETELTKEENIYSYLTSLKQNGYRIVVNVGRLTIQKGLPNLLKAAQKVIAHESKTIFLIVGSGEQEWELIEQAAELGIGRNIVFTGFQRGQPWRDAFSIGDVFVMPSVSEPFGLTPLEAIGYGTPTLISRQSGVSEVLQNTLKVDFWNVNEMANQITAVVRSKALCQELQDNAYREYKRLSWNKAADQLFDIYHRHMETALV